jgi:tetratricopeptide (TPR) repeat protein
MLLARIAMEREQWKLMSEQFTLAETAQGESADSMTAMISHANALLDKKEDAKAALEVALRAKAIASADDVVVLSVVGRSHLSLKQWQQAADALGAVLDKKPDARLARFGYAQALDKLGRGPEAIAEYREFARQYPQDDRASVALSAANRLERAKK